LIRGFHVVEVEEAFELLLCASNLCAVPENDIKGYVNGDPKISRLSRDELHSLLKLRMDYKQIKW
jgi:hypothetical protein